jgi:23S rRNA G2445 N2-methylase RlmL
MPTYYMSFPTGFEQVVRDALPERVPGARIRSLLPGAVEFTTAGAEAAVSSIGFCQNVFAVLHGERCGSGRPVETLLRNVHSVRLPRWIRGHREVRDGRTFRIVTSNANSPVSVSPRLRSAAEKRLRGMLRMSVARSGADVEVWFLARREGAGYILLRLTRRRATEKTLRKGQLRPEVCHLLCLMSKPRKSDRFLDPFCGYGAIVLERGRSFPATAIRAVDIDPAATDALRRAVMLERWGAVATVETGDARSLASIESGSVSAIVTDPPWGVYRGGGIGRGGVSDGELSALYGRMLGEFVRVLRVGGRAVVLMGRESPFPQELGRRSRHLCVDGRCNVLIGGRKAVVYSLVRSPGHGASS